MSNSKCAMPSICCLLFFKPSLYPSFFNSKNFFYFVVGIPFSHRDQHSSDGDNRVGQGILGGVLVFLLLSALVGVGFLLFLTKRWRRKMLQRMQLDIHAV